MTGKAIVYAKKILIVRTGLKCRRSKSTKILELGRIGYFQTCFKILFPNMLILFFKYWWKPFFCVLIHVQTPISLKYPSYYLRILKYIIVGMSIGPDFAGVGIKPFDLQRRYDFCWL